jgi:hypothetical protein
MPTLNFPFYEFAVKTEGGKRLIFDEVRKKYVALTPEEWVRQHLVRYLREAKGCPAGLIAVEAPLKCARVEKRSDVVVHNRQGEPLLIAECNAPDVVITQKVFEQIARYQQSLCARYLLMTNGRQVFCLNVAASEWLSDIPDYEELAGNHEP